MHQFPREEDAMMSLFLGGGLDALHTPLMSQGEEDSVDESKAPDPNVVDTGDSGGNIIHGDASRSGVAQPIAQSQRGNADDQDWNAEILNHVLVHVLDKEQVHAGATNDFTVFVIANGIDDAHFLLTVEEDDFNSMGHDINFKTFCALQTLKKMLNKQISDIMSEDDENVWFLNLGKWTVIVLHDA